MKKQNADAGTAGEQSPTSEPDSIIWGNGVVEGLSIIWGNSVGPNRSIDIAEVVAIAKWIHDTEHVNLGAASTRDYRNKFWDRAMGCVHYGHPTYNPTGGDPRWGIKDPDGPGGRPQSDDVAVQLTTRNFWDCIPGAGADGYRFEASYQGVLPPEQVAYDPSIPDQGAGTGSGSTPTTGLKPRQQFYDELREINAFYAAQDGLQRPGGMVLNGAADVEALGAWGYDLMTGKTVDECKAAIRQSDEYHIKHA